MNVPPVAMAPAADGTLSVLVTLDPQADWTIVAGAASPARTSLRSFAAQQHARVQYEYTVVPHMVNIRGLRPQELDALERLPGVSKVERDALMHTMHNDSMPLIRAYQSQIQDAGYPGVDGAGVRICIVDTGIDSNSVMYAGRIDTAAGWDFVNNDSDPEDDFGHGSHVAGTALGGFVEYDFSCPATGAVSMQGVAPAATLIGVKVLGADGSGSQSDVIAGIDRCASTALPGGRADVINMSLGAGQFAGTCDADPAAIAVNNAVAAGVVVVTAAGNSAFLNAVSTPACASGAITVAATYDTGYPNCDFPDRFGFGFGICNDNNPVADQRCCFSNRGAKLDVAAPGCLIFSNDSTAAAGDGLVGYCGTSQASPHVAGLAALLLDAYPSLTPEQVRAAIRGGAVDLGTPGFDTDFGFGRVDVVNALGWTLCTTDAQCDDQLYCDGAETCEVATGICRPGTNPCTSPLLCRESDDSCVTCLTDPDCDDGFYCNGPETCNLGEGLCQPGVTPCTAPLLCREFDQQCVPCLHSSASPGSGGSIVAWGYYVLAGDLSRNVVGIAAAAHNTLALKQDGSIVGWGVDSEGQNRVPAPNTNFVAVAAGTVHGLGLKSDGSIIGWGYDGNGEIDIPAANSDYIAIASGWNHSVGLKSNGSIVAWGVNDFGQTVVPAPNSGFVAISASGYYHSLGLKSDGSVVEWGCSVLDCSGEECICLQSGSVPPGSNTNFVAIAAGDLYSMALKSDGSIVAWGCDDLEGQYDEGQCNVPAPNTGFVAIAAGAYHAMGLKSDGSIVAWGLNFSGQTNIPSPNTDFVAISGGGFHSVGIKRDGSVVAWGENGTGETNAATPNTHFVAVSASPFHALGLRDDGSVVGWGCSPYTCGPTDCLDRGQCISPTPNTGFVAVAAGLTHSLGLKSNGAIVGWGDNESGQLNVPAPNTGFIDVKTGTNHGFGLKGDGSVVTWGCADSSSDWGQCYSPPPPNIGFVAIDTKGTFNLGLKSDGSIVGWGLNLWGQTEVPAPNTDFIGVAAGEYHGLGLKSDGSVVAWGCTGSPYNYGQCDVPPGGLNSRFVAVAAGTYQSLGLKDDGSVIVWGWNSSSPTSDSGVIAPNAGLTAMAGGWTISLGVRGDADSDGVLDVYDNCLSVVNPDQADCQDNCVGDVCETFADCNLNSIADECDISSGLSQDLNANDLPDDCEQAVGVLPDTEGATKSRALVFSVPSSATTGPGSVTALRVALIELQNPVPSNAPCCPPPNFSSYELGACGDPSGCVRWVGRPVTVRESQDNPGFGSYTAARLQCTPYYQDWGVQGSLRVVGAEILPSSTYEVVNVAAACADQESSCATVSSPLTIKTARFGDIASPYAPAGTQPDPQDVVAVLNKFRNQPGSLSKAIAQTQPNVIELNNDVGALDIVSAIDAFRGTAYPYSGPCPCPSSVTCNATSCSSGSACSGGLCIKTCSGGTASGQPCLNSTHCPGGSCPSGGFCRDRCGRCQ